MTTETEALKTNEILRRRKLRIQQVREQSKEIAKKLRQRAKVEKLRHLEDLDAKKEREYFEHQDKLVKKLEEYYAKGLRNVGVSHKNASEAENKENEFLKVDLSKKRGKEAAAELRRRKQEKLDEQKKLLDRKLQARENANEISREKSAALASKLLGKPSSNNGLGTDSKADKTTGNKEDNKNDERDKAEVVTCDMATQWDFDQLPNEWEPHVPELALPKDDRDSAKESVNKTIDNKSPEKSKRINLFALSDEMPSSLRGGLTSVPEETVPVKSSFTLVSEYLQNRGLRLRESDVPSNNKKNVDDLQTIKQTILKTRSSSTEGSSFQYGCHVADGQVVPVPSWQAETQCGFCPHDTLLHKHSTKSRQFKSITNSQINKIFSSIRPVQHDGPSPSPVLRGSSPFLRSKMHPRTLKGNAEQKSSKHSEPESALFKKNSVMMYNHSTRDTKDIPCGDKHLVTRDPVPDEDAYSQAMKESSCDSNRESQQQKKLQDMRHKMAMTRQTVEKEYKDTMAFLKSLPKDKSKPIKNAYMDEKRMQMQNETRQRKMQQEFKKIEKECRKTNLNSKPTTTTHDTLGQSRHKSKSPKRIDSDDDVSTRDFQYSWMPVPESDGSLAIHTIPTTVKDGKSNTVTFSKVDSYHEYRSRHKHTPPTKDTPASEKHTNQRVIEAVLIDEEATESSEYSSIASDTSSVENLQVNGKMSRSSKNKEERLSDAERIIIYKILDSKIGKKDKTNKQAKLIKEIAKSLTNVNSEKLLKSLNIDGDSNKKGNSKSRIQNKNNADTRVSFEQLNEGVYKTVNEKGDNITAMYFTDSPREGQNSDEGKPGRLCSCGNKTCKHIQTDTGVSVNWESSDEPPRSRHSERETSKRVEGNRPVQPAPSEETSATSFKTATNNKTNSVQQPPDQGFVKLVDEIGQEAGKFYIGATGFLKDEDYEVIIQLRKKDAAKEPRKDTGTESVEVTPSSRVTEDNKDQDSKSIAQVEAVDAQKEPDQENNEIVIPTQGEGDSRKSVNDRESALLSSNSRNNLRNDENPINLGDKGVYTPFQQPYSIPSVVKKSELNPRPATSTYTQTTLGSPDQRPMFVHMSSSTSTAYMSPPELILPRFLKHDYKVSYDEMCDVTLNSNLQDERIELLNQETVCCEEYSGCKCKRCVHARKVVVSKVKSPMFSKKTQNMNNKKVTPPNTARTTTTSENEYEIYHVSRRCKKAPEFTIPDPKSGRSKICRKCEKHSRSKICSKNNNINKNKKDIASNTGLTNKCGAVPTLNPRNKNNYQNSKRITNCQLNPVIKTYVHKLLSLNRESIKAIEVMNQDCSSVTTPSSSIIDVPRNTDKKNTRTEQKISLNQIKEMLAQQVLQSIEEKQNYDEMRDTTARRTRKNNPVRFPKKKLHKVKSLNISKKIFNSNLEALRSNQRDLVSSTSSSKVEYNNIRKPVPSVTTRKSRSKSSPSPRKTKNNDLKSKTTLSDIVAKTSSKEGENNLRSDNNMKSYFQEHKRKLKEGSRPISVPPPTPTSSETDSPHFYIYPDEPRVPLTMSTQTNQMIDSEINFMKLAEDKLQNMEKIADLTEKCTKRLSNLAKVLEEVRKNKSLAYSQISDSASDSDRKSDKDRINTQQKLSAPSYEGFVEAKTAVSNFDEKSENNIPTNPPSPPSNELYEMRKEPEIVTPLPKNMEVKEKSTSESDFIPLLTDIPKHIPTNSPSQDEQADIVKPTIAVSSSLEQQKTPAKYVMHPPLEHSSLRNKTKPPPALSRINLKQGQDYVIPHELSTVIEVDSPMSLKMKNQSVNMDSKHEIQHYSNSGGDSNKGMCIELQPEDSQVNPDLVQSNIKLSRRQANLSSTDSSDDSKMQMLDLKQFNEIMLKPFITLQEYAKQCNAGVLDEGSTADDMAKDDVVTEDVSSLQSDGSLPDVIAELLKRNIISEPFKFDTASNINSTSVSSESTLSMLALSKIRKDKKNTMVSFQNKENVAETSDTLSISSNPDLEDVFMKLRMGWASSTLKKTKERLALSSSSNTSSSSVSQFKVKKNNNQDIPALVSESVSSVYDVSKNGVKKKVALQNSKNAEQQTSQVNSMTVKEFLTNELAKKITFTNKSHRDDTEEFVSLYETRMPEEMKHSSQMVHEEPSVDSGSNNRARTSTPVQIFKSMTYHSSSSSNVSNGLFSNADDLSSVKGTSNSMRNHSTSDKDDLTIPNYSLRVRKGNMSDCSKSD